MATTWRGLPPRISGMGSRPRQFPVVQRVLVEIGAQCRRRRPRNRSVRQPQARQSAAGDLEAMCVRGIFSDGGQRGRTIVRAVPSGACSVSIVTAALDLDRRHRTAARAGVDLDSHAVAKS
jgi:hypothetical protein